ncbi:MAG: hypothetical protein WCK27_32805, partial [Verrucomicrobiota bacterium]
MAAPVIRFTIYDWRFRIYESLGGVQARMSHAARNWNLLWGVSGAELLAAWKRRALSSPLTLRVNAEGRMQKGEWL